jgi:hypothetical protein
MNMIGIIARGGAAAAVALGLPSAAAAQDFNFEYAAKIVCGRIINNSGPLSMGTYQTAVNIHNPGDDQPFRRKVAIAPQGSPGPISKFKMVTLKPDQAMEVDCRQIIVQMGESGLQVTAFTKGFLVIQSPRELDVVAVYTAAPTATGQVASIHTERVPARRR